MSAQINTKQIAPSGAATGQALVFNGANWTPDNLNGMKWFETLADMAAAPGPGVRTLAWQIETVAPYEFVPGDVTPIDGFTSVGNTGGFNGRWLLRSDQISLAPLGNALDDWPRYIAAANAMTGKVLRARSGTWIVNTFGLLPNAGIALYWEPGSTIVQTLPSAPQLVGAAFSAKMVVLGALLSLQVNNVVEQSTVSLSGTVPVVVGQETHIYIQDTTSPSRAARYQVLSQGPGPGFVAQLDRPVQWQFTAGDVVSNVIPPQNIRIFGNGLKMIGTGDRFCHVQGGIDCYVENVHMSDAVGAPESFWFSWDAGSYRCSGQRCTASGVGINTVALFVLETGESNTFVKCSARGGVNAPLFTAGQAIYDSYRCFIQDGIGTECTIGAQVGSQDPTNLGCKECGVSGNFDGNVTQGVRIGGGSIDTQLGSDVPLSANGNGAFGVQLQPTSGVNVAPHRTHFTNVVTHGNGNSGINLGTGATSTTAAEIDVAGNGSYGVFGNAPIDIEQLTSLDAVAGGNPNGVMYSAAGPINVRGFDVQMADAGLTLFDMDAGVQSSFSNGTARCPGSCNAFRNTGATMTIEDVDVVFASTLNVAVQHNSVDAGSVVILRNVKTVGGGGGSKGYVGAAGCTLREYDLVNFDSAATPYTINAAGFANRRGFITLAAAPIAYPWPNLNGGDRILTTQITGAPTPCGLMTFNIGVGFTVGPGLVGAQFGFVIGP